MRKVIKSFRFAGEGFVSLLLSERNFRIEILTFFLVLVLAFWLPLTETEVVLILIVSGNVLVSEMMNTVLEKLLDMQSKRRNLRVKFLKDAMAAAVVVNVVIAVVTGGIIFSRYLFF